MIKNVTPSDAGIYTVYAKNELGEDHAEMHLIVKCPPRFKTKVENQTCIVEKSHTMKIEIEGAPVPKLTFMKEGVELKETENIKITRVSDELYEITLKSAKITDTGSYSVVAKNEFSQCSDVWQLFVAQPPKLTQMLGGMQECGEGDNVAFQIKLEGDPKPTVKWY